MNDGGILVIKLGALGDFVLAMGPFAAIRAHHTNVRITLLTTQPFAELARRSNHFDDIWIDQRTSRWNLLERLSLCRSLQAGHFTRVYDLQTSGRSSNYYRCFKPPRPEWSGIAKGCSHPHTNPARDFMHTKARQREQLVMAGIEIVPGTDLSWLDGDIATLVPEGAYALLVPGGSAHRTEKRWPAKFFGELAQSLFEAGYTPLLLGKEAEQDVIAKIVALVPTAHNLCGRTDFAQIAALARGAVAAIGNDTGPMHLIAATGCPTTVLFSDDSDPDLTAPVGQAVTILRRPHLGDLPVAEVRGSLTLFQS
ncbi:MAG: ADP-heptose--LPS heptosyltransferase [Rhodospirillaceae bacterium]|nr:ADP-heptose--LPS heptosyltransferase [Rhodospirillaceae bacterium]